MSNLPWFYQDIPDYTVPNDFTELEGGSLDDLVRAQAISYLTNEILRPPIDEPVINLPTNQAELHTGGILELNISISDYIHSTTFNGPHTATTYQIGADENFINVLEEDLSNTTDLTAKTWTGLSLPLNNWFYLRVRYESNYYTSRWSNVVSFRFVS